MTVDAPAEEASEPEAEAPQLAEAPAPEAETGLAVEAVPALTDGEPFVEAVSEVAVEAALEATERTEETSLPVDVAETESADAEPEPALAPEPAPEVVPEVAPGVIAEVVPETGPEVESVPKAASEADAAVAVADYAAAGPEADGATPEESPVAVE